MGKATTFIVISVAAALSGAAFSAVFDFKYLSSASNDVAATLAVSDGNPSQEDRQRVASEACSALQQLLGDPQLPELLQRAERARASSADKKTLQLLYSDLGMFNRFASTEAEKLRAAGYSPAAVAQIIADLSFARPGSVEARPPLNAIISKLSYVVCGVSKKQEVSNYQLGAIGLGLGGVALIGVDVFVPGLEVLAPASAEVGGTLIGKAIEAL